MAPLWEVDRYVSGTLAGDRTVLARTITLIESRRADHRERARAVLAALLPASGDAHRVGITGVPGVGKSTFIDQLGSNLTRAGHRVAVLAVDPSSTRTGGSILGDKTRMGRLAADPQAFVRPSPTGTTLGGVTSVTRETMVVCEAAGFDVVLVETVGVGQSETMVADMVDMFCVLMLPGAGDELQGIKKGILELADLVAVNKADGDNLQRAQLAAAELKRALHLLAPASPNWSPPVMCVSALTNEAVPELWEQVVEHRRVMSASGELEERRRSQQVRWMWGLLEDRLIASLHADEAVAAVVRRAESAVRSGEVPAPVAAEEIWAAYGSAVGRSD
ncbi:MAG: methylmalonyl Co-A mutase-associated GTPase MeaB [Microthrixaceae bacterium]